MTRILVEYRAFRDGRVLLLDPIEDMRGTYNPPAFGLHIDGQHYEPLFWNFSGIGVSRLNAERRPARGPIDLNMPELTATVWYVQVGSGDGHGVSALAFDEGQNAFLAESPIAEVEPNAPSVWAGGDATYVDTAREIAPDGVTIYPKRSMGFSRFDTWLLFGDGTQTDDQIHVPADGSCWLAIACYRVHEFVHELLRKPPEEIMADPVMYDLARKLTHEQVKSTLTNLLAQRNRLDAGLKILNEVFEKA